MLGEDAAIVEVGGVLGPADANDPVTTGFSRNGGKKHGETGDGGVPTVPQAERQDNERRSGNGEQDAESEPTAAIAAKIQELGQEQHESEEDAKTEVAEPVGGGFLRGRDGGRGRAHYLAFWGRVLF